MAIGHPQWRSRRFESDSPAQTATGRWLRELNDRRHCPLPGVGCERYSTVTTTRTTRPYVFSVPDLRRDHEVFGKGIGLLQYADNQGVGIVGEAESHCRAGGQLAN